MGGTRWRGALRRGDLGRRGNKEARRKDTLGDRSRETRREGGRSREGGIREGEVVGLAVKRRISGGGKNRGTEDKVDSSETKCHLSSGSEPMCKSGA